MSRSTKIGLSMVLVGVALVALFGCSEQPLTRGLEEPFSVQDAQFVEGELPGKPPLSAEDIQEGKEPVQPQATGGITDVFPIASGTAAVEFRGFTTPDALSVGMKLEGQGSGYWLFPTGSVAAAYDGQLQWTRLADFHKSAKPGRHRMLFAAIGKDGKSGTQYSSTVCLLPEVPDNGNACNPQERPPGAVVSLSWDTPVDLDLRLRTPNGQLVDAKDPSSAIPPEGSTTTDPTQPGTGVLDFDSNQECVIDGVQRENVVFETSAPSGLYQVYANLYSACGEKAVSYEVTLHLRVPGDKPDTFGVQEIHLASGVALDFHANGDAQIGTFVTEFLIP